MISPGELGERLVRQALQRPPDDRPPPLGLVDVFAATIPSLDFQPGVHVNYAEKTVLPMKDGLPELKDFPAEFGGSGEVMAE